MRIDSYKFGRIVINGRNYSSDVIIYHNRVAAEWIRAEDHRLHPEDVADVLNAQPDVLIIGTGYAGVMMVPKELAAHFESQGIEVMVEKTPRAVELYNSFVGTKKYVIAALHITC